MIFKDRTAAGEKLAEALTQYKNAQDTIILALPRGGVAVGFEVARALNLPLDIVVPRKIGAPGNPEFAIGAITETGEGIFDEQTITAYGISQNYINETVKEEKAEALRRLKTYRGSRPPLNLTGKTVVIVDDGLATGLTMRAAIKTIKNKNAKKIIVAIPVGPPDTIETIKKEADGVVCLDTPVFFGAVGAFYEEFGQTTDEEVIELLKKAEEFEK